MSKLYIVRHGQSEWNKKNIFTGKVNVGLSPAGIEEAFKAGEAMKDVRFDRVFVSSLDRAKMTAMLALSKNSNQWTPVVIPVGAAGKASLPKKIDDKSLIYVEESPLINERDYGALAGRNKDSVLQEFGEEQFKIWRRGFDVPPPDGESLEMTIDRVRPFFNGEIIPALKNGETVLISAHGNSIRGMVMEMEKLTPKEILGVEIPTGKPMVYEYTDGAFTRGAV